MLFRCLRSGNTVNIDDPDDIERMKFHEGYTQVEVSAHSQGENHAVRPKENESPENAATLPRQDAEAKEVKRRGRRPKPMEI